MKPKRWLPMLCAAVLPWIAGCRSFETEWKDAAVTASDPPIPGTGRWIGTWGNTNNSHGGPLRAVLKSTDGTHYTARFLAGWGRHSGSFRTPLRGEWHDGECRFEGSKRVFGFRIETRGVLTDTTLEASYSSLPDRGHFSLRRPAGGP